MSFEGSRGSGKGVFIAGGMVLLLGAGGLIFVVERARTHGDSVNAAAAIKTSEAAAKVREAAIAAKQVLVGMTREEVERAWGKPDKINQSTSGGGLREQWVFESGSYVYFGNEKVTSVEK